MTNLHKHRSRAVAEGLTRASHRAFLRANRLAGAAIQNQFVAIVYAFGENTPCSMSINPVSDSVCPGVAAGGGVPKRDSAISVFCWYVNEQLGHAHESSITEAMVDSVELFVRAHACDALVGVAGCDKALSGIFVDARADSLSNDLSDDEFARRGLVLSARPGRRPADAPEKSEAVARSAHLGAITHFGELGSPYGAPTQGDLR